jgi:hypothetical protein
MEKLSWLENLQKCDPLLARVSAPAVDQVLAASVFDYTRDDSGETVAEKALSVYDEPGDASGPDLVGDLIKTGRDRTGTTTQPLEKRAQGTPMSLFFQLSKIDEEKRMVFGCAAAEEPDRQGEILDYVGSKPYFKAWSESVRKDSQGKSAGNVREMHTLSAVGALEQIQFDDAAKRIEVAAKIIDDDAWRKCKAGVYCGFSIGGKYAKSWPDGKLTRYVADPSEVSLVDRPAIPSATFELVKTDGTIEICKLTDPKQLPGETKMTDKEREARSHKSEAAHHRTMAEIHGNLVAKSEGMDDNEKAFHEGSKAAHLAAAGDHDAMAAECEKADKAEKAVAESDLNKLIPTNVSAVHGGAPGITAVARPGGRPVPAAPNVPLEFQKMVAVDDDNMERTHL